MKEHVEKSSAIVDSTAVEEIVTGKGKIDGVLSERDEGEDVMVDVVGADAIDLDRKADSVHLIEECVQKETETRDLNVNMDMKEEVAGSGEDGCLDSAQTSVLALEKAEITVNDEGSKTSIEVGDCEMAFESKGESQFGGVDIAAIDDKKQYVESVVEFTRKETKTRDLNMNMEEAAVSVEDDSVGNRVLGFEKVEVTVNEKGSKTSIEVGDCEMAFESKGESQFGGADIAAIDNKEQHVESVVECMQKETLTFTRDLNMNMEVAVSAEDDSVENRVVGFEKVEVTVNEEDLNTSLEVSKDVLQEKVVTTCGSLVQDSKESSIGGVELVAIDNKDVIERGSTEEVMDQCVESRKTKKEAEILESSKIGESLEVDMMAVDGFASKDEAKDCVFVDSSLVSANNQNSSTELVNVGSDEASRRSKEESLQPMIEVITDVSQGNASGEPCFVGGENDLKNKEESERCLPKEIMECDQELGGEDCTLNEKIVNESELLDSSKISEPLTTTNPGSEDVDVVVVDTGLASIDEAQDGVSVDPNFVCKDDAIPQVENVDQQDEVIANNAQNLENGIGVGDSKSSADLLSGEPRFDAETAVLDNEETEKGLTLTAENEKIPETLTTVNLGQEEFLTPKIETQDSASVDQRLVCPTENSDPRSEDGLVESQRLKVNVVVKIENEDKNCMMNGLHEGSGFSYEDRGEDAGMDIDEVLGWKDEMPGIDVLNGEPEKDQNFKINADSEVGFKKRKVLDSISEGSEKQPTLHPEKVPISTPKPSFKVGECIQRVASQLSGPPSVGQHVDQLIGPENSENETGNKSSVAEMLSQLHLVAQDPMNGYTFLNTIKPFFNDHRTAVARPLVIRKRKTSNENEPEEFEFDDVNDSYWTDRIIQNHAEEQPLQENQNGGQERHFVSYEPDKPAKPNRRSNKKRFMFSNHEMGLKEQSELVERRRQNLATEVVLKFPEGFYFPSEIHLNKMFRRFGALMESETEVDRQNGRARVVFKKCCDAEVAHSSAGKFNIFGPINVNYELNYTPLVSYKPLPLSLLQQGPMDAS